MEYLNKWLPKRWDIRQKFTAADVALNFGLFTPIVVLHYHATSYFLDIVFCRYSPRFGALVLLAIGLSIEFTIGIWQKRFPTLIQHLPETEFYHLMAGRLFNYVLAFANICHIKAVTDIFLLFGGTDLDNAIKATTTGILVLCGIRCVRNIVAIPLGIGFDSGETDNYECATIFQTEPDVSVESMMDTAATVGVVYTFVHLHWAGVTSLLDNILFPHTYWLSMLFSLVIGYIIVCSVLISEEQTKKISRDLERERELYKIAFEDFYAIAAGFGVIAIWRGYWMLFDILSFYFPIYYSGFDVTPVAANLISFAILSVANITNTLTYKSCDLDGSMKDGEGVACGYGYLTVYLYDFIEEEEANAKLPPESPVGEPPIKRDVMDTNMRVPPAPKVVKAPVQNARKQIVVRRKVKNPAPQPPVTRPAGKKNPAPRPPSSVQAQKATNLINGTVKKGSAQDSQLKKSN